MKKISVFMVVVVLILGTMSGCSAASGTSDESLIKIKEKGVLVLGTSADYPPYEFHVEVDGMDTIVGFDIEIAKSIAERIGVELEIIDMKFEGLLPALNAGKIDLVIAGMTPTEERKQSVDFSTVYYKEKQAVVVRADDSGALQSIDGFDGKSIGVQKATIQEELAAVEFTESTIKGLDKIPNLILELKTGKIDAAILVSPAANAYVKANSDLAVTAMEFDSEDGSAIAVKKNSGELLDIINLVLDELITSGSLDQFIIEAVELSDSLE